MLSTSSQVMAAASERLSPASRTRRHSAISTLPTQHGPLPGLGPSPIGPLSGDHGRAPNSVEALGKKGYGLPLGARTGGHSFKGFGDNPVPPRVIVVLEPAQPEGVDYGTAGQPDGGDGHSQQFQLIQVANNIDRPCRHCLETHFPAPHFKIPPVPGVGPAGVREI